MSFSYSGLSNYGKATLPSVEGGFGSMNVLRDPPKSISTRRKIRVGETNSLTTMVDDSGNRSCEAISLYARGVNPFVSVDYGNAGNNGGQRSGGITGGSTKGNQGMNGGQAFLPYRIMRDGAFRPPELRQENLLPLSRTSRLTTAAYTNKGFVDFSKKLKCQNDNCREVKKEPQMIRSSVRPTATYKMSTQMSEPFEVKYVIKNPIKVSAESGVRSMDRTVTDVKIPTKEINNNLLRTAGHVNYGSSQTVRNLDNMNIDTERYMQDPLHSDVTINYGSSQTVRNLDNINIDTERYLQDPLHSNTQTNISEIRHIDNNGIDTERYLQDPLNSEVYSKQSQSIRVTPIDELYDVDIRTKDIFNINYTPTPTGYIKEDFIHKDIELDRRVILTEASSGKQQNIYVRPEVEYQKTYTRNMPNVEVYANKGTMEQQSGFDLTNREYKLKPTINPGSFDGKGQMPMVNNYMNNNIDSNMGRDKSDNNKKILSMYQNRYV
jgi:hypothetical protein